MIGEFLCARKILTKNMVSKRMDRRQTTDPRFFDYIQNIVYRIAMQQVSGTFD